MTKESIGYMDRSFGISFYVTDDFGMLVEVPDHDFHAVLVFLKISSYQVK